MKVAITFIVFIFSFASQAQNAFNAGFTTGLITSQIYGDGYSGFDKIGIKGGFFLETNLQNDFKGCFEMIYIQKGSRNPANPAKGKYTSNAIRANYIEVPVYLKKQFGKFVYEAGLTFGRNISQNYFNESGKINTRDLFGKYELGYLFGLNYELNDKISTNIRYSNTIYARAPGIRIVDYGFFNRLSVFKGPTHILLAFGIHYKILNND